MDAAANSQSLADFLSSVEILSPFARDELERLAEQAQSRFYSFGDSVCNAGDVADGLLVIKSGSVRIFAEEQGKEISMGVRKEREVVAEMARPQGPGGGRLPPRLQRTTRHPPGPRSSTASAAG